MIGVFPERKCETTAKQILGTQSPHKYEPAWEAMPGISASSGRQAHLHLLREADVEAVDFLRAFISHQ